MNTYSQKHFSQSALYALAASGTIVALLFTTFFIAEPAISYGQSDTASFTIQQTITDETTFLVNPSDVTMVGSIAGLTGGNATGTSSFVVKTNNATGYYVDISFQGDPQAMVGDDDADEGILDYEAATMEPTYNFTTSAAAQFAYTVTSSSSNHTDLSFLDGGASCGTGSGQGSCWMAPSTTAVRIVDFNGTAASGASSTVQFKVHVPNSPSPALTAQTYTATATLSLYTQ